MRVPPTISRAANSLVKFSYKSKLDRLSYNVFMKPSNNTQLYPVLCIRIIKLTSQSLYAA